MTKRIPIENPAVAAVFGAYPPKIAARLLRLRQLIFEVAARTEGVGALEETLKWGQPSYLTTQSGSGSLVRIDQLAAEDGKYAMYFHCQTTLVDTFRQMFPGRFAFSGNRSILFDVEDELPLAELGQCVAMALTYHRNKRRTLAAPAPRPGARRGRGAGA